MGLDGTNWTTLSRVMTQVREHGAFAGETIGAFAMGSIDETLPVFARDAPGELLRPVTAAASRIFEGSDGARAQRILATATSLADERPGSLLRGLVLPDDPDALGGWWRLREAANGVASGVDPELAVHYAPADTSDAARAAFRDAIAHFEGGFVADLSGGPIASLVERRPIDVERSIRTTLGATAPQELVQRVASRETELITAQERADQLATLVHEFEHADGIVDYRVGAPARAELSRIFEEGGNNVVTHWPGRLDDVARRAGIAGEVDAATLARTHSYSNETEVTRDLVARTGVDVTDPAALPDAIRLLRGQRTFDSALDDLTRGVALLEPGVTRESLEQSMLRTPATDRLNAQLEALRADAAASAAS